jgi:phosphopantothenoylcysteine decarboxylase/phosphopantothenate--cysteine ligase
MPHRRRLLITAGPTHEPIDEVRYLGNRSSGRLGLALADHAASHGWTVTLLLGPTPLTPSDSRVAVHRFRTTADLAALLARLAPACDALVMAAAVADYRPKPLGDQSSGKIRRSEQQLVLELEPTPDLLARAAADKRQDQVFVGFALEPADRLISSATDKLRRKRLDMVVANPLETMDSETIDAVVLSADGARHETRGAISKQAFGPWLLKLLERALQGPRTDGRATPAAPRPRPARVP